MFDKNWENNIYKKNRQINNYPSEWVVSNTYKYIIKKFNLKKANSSLECQTQINHALRLVISQILSS